MYRRLTRPHADAPMEARTGLRDSIYGALDEAGIAPGEVFFMEITSDEPTPPRARRKDPPTAKAAASLNPGGRETQRRRSIVAIGDAGLKGLIAHEVQDVTGIDYASLTPRLGALKRDGLVREQAGSKRLGRRNTDQAVLVLTEKGREVYNALPEVMNRNGGPS